MSQKPTPTRMVLVIGGAAVANGTDTAPAVITRVWGDERSDGGYTVNTLAFPDAGTPSPVTSVHLVDDEATARALYAEMPAPVAYWPPRV